METSAVQQSQPVSAPSISETPTSDSGCSTPSDEIPPEVQNRGNMFGPASQPALHSAADFEDSIVPEVKNVISSVDLGCPLSLKKIALHARNAEYNPKRYLALIMRILNPRATAIIFSSGKLMCMGTKSETDCNLATRKFARIVQKVGFPVKFIGFKIGNIVLSVDVKFPIRIDEFVQTHSQFCRYEPEMFAGVVYRMVKSRVVMLIFVTGKIMITGAKVRQEAIDAFKFIYPVLKSFKKR